MIEYDRTNWFGLSYLYKLRGSLLPRCLPAMLLGAAISAAVEVAEGFYDVEVVLGDKYSMQLFGLVFGYLSIARLNISYNRYWEGASQIHIMHSKWADAASQALAFDRIDDAREDIDDDFCVHVVRLFCQFSAMATATLHMTAEELAAMWAHLEAELAATPSSCCAASAEVAPFQAAARQAAPNGEGAGSAARAPRGGSGGGGGGGDGGGGGGAGGVGAVACRALLLSQIFDASELDHVRAAPCPVLCTEHRLSRAISTRFRSRGWRAPAPVVSRIFQEMSNGMVACACRKARTPRLADSPAAHQHRLLLPCFAERLAPAHASRACPLPICRRAGADHSARKITKIAMPFAYVQFNALLLVLFNCLSPIAIGSFTTSPVFSIATSAITCAGFAAMFLVANELEDPFGSDDNDLPVIEEHQAFVAQMRSLLRWLPSDTFGAQRASLEIEMDTSWQTVARAIGDGSLKAALASEGGRPEAAAAADRRGSRAGYDIPLGHRGDAEAVQRSSDGASEPGSPFAALRQKKRRGDRACSRRGHSSGAPSPKSAASGSAHGDVAIEHDAFAA